MNLRVIGHTNQQEVWVGSDGRPFKINEFLIIEDERHKNPLVEVVETSSLDDSQEKLTLLGLKKSSPEFKSVKHIARVNVMGELLFPIAVGANVIIPKFEDIKHVVMKKGPEKGLTLGVIRGTGDLHKTLPSELSNIAPLFDKEKGVIPQEGIPFILDHYGLKEYPHLFFCGTSGSGKSVALRVTVEELMKKRLPNLLGDPHHEFDFNKAFEGIPESYKENFENRYIVCTIGEDASIKFEDLSSDELCNALASAKKMSGTMESAVKAIYKKGEPLVSFQSKIERLLDAFEKNGKVKDGQTMALYEKTKASISGVETLKAISWRFNSLIKDGLFNDKEGLGISKVVDGIKQRKTVVIRGSINLLNVFIGYAANNMYRKRRRYTDIQRKGLTAMSEEVEKFPPFFITLDEAHKFCPYGEESTPTKTVLREIAQEGRKYGINLIFATQRPSLLDSTITGMINTKIIFRTTRDSDKQTIREETDLGAIELKRLPFLDSGNAFISSAIIGRSTAVRFRITKTESPHTKHPFDELEDIDAQEEKKTNELESALLSIIDEEGGILELSIQEHLSNLLIRLGRRVSLDEAENALEEMVKKCILIKEETGIVDSEYKRASL